MWISQHRTGLSIKPYRRLWFRAFLTSSNYSPFTLEEFDYSTLAGLKLQRRILDCHISRILCCHYPVSLSHNLVVVITTRPRRAPRPSQQQHLWLSQRRQDRHWDLSRDSHSISVYSYCVITRVLRPTPRPVITQHLLLTLLSNLR